MPLSQFLQDLFLLDSCGVHIVKFFWFKIVILIKCKKRAWWIYNSPDLKHEVVLLLFSFQWTINNGWYPLNVYHRGFRSALGRSALNDLDSTTNIVRPDTGVRRSKLEGDLLGHTAGCINGGYYPSRTRTTVYRSPICRNQPHRKSMTEIIRPGPGENATKCVEQNSVVTHFSVWMTE